MYSDKIIEIFKNPTNAGGLQGANGASKYVDETCGDCYKIYLKIDESETIIDSHFKTLGSTCAIVASSVIASVVVGMTISEAKALTEEAIIAVTGEFPKDKKYTLTSAISALRASIENFEIAKEKAIKSGKPMVYPELKEKEPEVKNEKKTVEYAKEESSRPVSKTRAAFEEMFKAWEE